MTSGTFDGAVRAGPAVFAAAESGEGAAGAVDAGAVELAGGAKFSGGTTARFGGTRVGAAGRAFNVGEIVGGGISGFDTVEGEGELD